MARTVHLSEPKYSFWKWGGIPFSYSQKATILRQDCVFLKGCQKFSYLQENGACALWPSQLPQNQNSACQLTFMLLNFAPLQSH